jgi:PAT family beta-lactamase induction signal transducer AmpG
VLKQVAATFVEPLQTFSRRHGAYAALAFALVCTYRLPDLVPSPIAGPFLLDLRFTLVETAEVRRVWGIVMTMVGVAAGGLAVTRFGLWRALVAGALSGIAGRLALAWLATQGPDMGALIVTTVADQAAAGFAGTCLVAYMSSLTTGGSTATQYALLSSLFALPGRLLASQSGRIVEAAAHSVAVGGILAPLTALFSGLSAGSYGLSGSPAAISAGYLVVFLYSALLGLLPLALTIWIARRLKGSKANSWNWLGPPLSSSPPSTPARSDFRRFRSTTNYLVYFRAAP